MSTFFLEIYTPFGKYFDHPVDELIVQSEDFSLGILPHHAPLVAKIKVSKMTIIKDGERKEYAVGEGLINVTKDGTTLLLSSIESKDEIDIERAKQAKKRAEMRIANPLNVDIERATKALNRANNRISLFENE